METYTREITSVIQLIRLLSEQLNGEHCRVPGFLESRLDCIDATIIEVNKAHEKLLSSINDFESLPRRVKELEQEKSILKEGQGSLKKGQGSLKNDREALKNDQESLRKKGESLQKDQESLHKDRQCLERDQGSLRSDQESLGRDRESLRKEDESLQMRQRAFREELEAFEKRESTLQDDILRVQNDISDAVVALNDKHKALEVKQERERKEFALRNDILGVKKDISAAITVIDEKLNAVSAGQKGQEEREISTQNSVLGVKKDISDAVTALDYKLSGLSLDQEERDTLRRELSDEHDEAGRLTGQKNVLASQLEDEIAETRRLEKDLQDEKASRDKTWSEVCLTHAAYVLADNERTWLSEELRQAKLGIERLEQDLRREKEDSTTAATIINMNLDRQRAMSSQRAHVAAQPKSMPTTADLGVQTQNMPTTYVCSAVQTEGELTGQQTTEVNSLSGTKRPLAESSSQQTQNTTPVTGVEGGVTFEDSGVPHKRPRKSAMEHGNEWHELISDMADFMFRVKLVLHGDTSLREVYKQLATLCHDGHCRNYLRIFTASGYEQRWYCFAQLVEYGHEYAGAEISEINKCETHPNGCLQVSRGADSTIICRQGASSHNS